MCGLARIVPFGAILLSCLAVQAEQTLFLVGASTLDEHQKWIRSNVPYASWGRALEPYLKDGWVIENNAYSGKSVKSAMYAPVSEIDDMTLWAYTTNAVRRGDYVIIQFGHNDMKPGTAYFSTPAEYKVGLAQMAADVRRLGATPVFATSIRRAQFQDGVLCEKPIGEYVLGDYAQAMREIGAEIGVEVIDLHTLTGEYLSQLGREKAESLYVGNAKVDLNGEGEYDVTHPVAAGALAFSWLFYNEVKTRPSGISEIFKANAPRNYVPVKPYTREKSAFVSVGQGQTATLLEALGMTLGEFKNAQYERLVKTGMGTLVMDQDIRSYAIDIIVEEGVLSVANKDALGARGTDLTNGFVVVRNQATLEWAASATYSPKRIYFEGTGVDGHGALVARDLASATAKYWAGVMFVETGNATVFAGGSSKTPALFYGSQMLLNGFTTTVELGEKSFAFGPVVGDTGTFVFTSGLVELKPELTLPEDSSGMSCLVCNGCKINLSQESYPNVGWPLEIARTPSSFQVNSNGTQWPSAIEISAGQTLNFSGSSHLEVVGGLSGAGDVVVSGGGVLALGKADENFRGRVSVRNGSVVRMPRTTSERTVWPGLVAGYGAAVKDEELGGHLTSEWSSRLPEMPTLTNAVETTFQRLTGGVAIPDAPVGANRQVYTYSGYLMNSSATAEVWAVEVNLKHYVDLQIGGSTTLFSNWNQYAVPRVAKVMMQPGANSFSLKCYVSGAQGGLASVSGKDGKKYPGLGYIRNPNQTLEELADTAITRAADWTAVTMDTEGELFCCAQSESEVRWLSEKGLLEQSLTSAVLGDVSFSDGSMLAIDGCEMVVSNLTGVGTVCQAAECLDGNALRVIGTWTLANEVYESNQPFRSEVKVVFGSNAKILLDYDAVIRGVRPHTILVSDVGIEGTPEIAFTDGLAHPIMAVYSADGKRLFVDSEKRPLIVIFK